MAASTTMKVGGLIAAALALLCGTHRAYALDPNQPINNYLRTRITTEDGLPSNIVNEIVQSSDGFLWLTFGSEDMFRFDGKRFSSISIPHVHAMAIGPNGDLWVGSGNDLKQIPASELSQSNPKPSTTYHTGLGSDHSIKCLQFSRSGLLWVGTTGGLFRLEGGVLSKATPQPGIYKIEEASNGHLLISTNKGFVEWDGSRAIRHPEIETNLGVGPEDILHVMEDSHGVTWFCTKRGVARRVRGSIEKLQPWGENKSKATRVYEDPQGGLWIFGTGGFFRATSAGLEPAVPHLDVRYMYGDRDGDLWIGSNGDGLIRLKDRAVRMFTTADGLPNKVVMTVLASHDGTLWAGSNCGGLSHWDGQHFRVYNSKNGLLNDCVYSLAEDANHDLWVGTFGGGAFRFHDGNFTQYSKPQGLLSDIVPCILPTRDGSVWLVTPQALTRLRKGELRSYTTADGLSRNYILKIYEDGNGGIWVGTIAGIDRMVGDRFVQVSAIPPVPALPIGDDQSGGIYVGIIAPGPLNSSSVLHVDDGQSHEVISHMLATNMTRTERGDVWLNGSGIMRVSSASLTERRAHDEPLDAAEFGTGDGLISTEGSDGYPNSTLTPDGKFWVATVQGIAMFDLPRLARTEQKPTIYMEEVQVGRNQQHAGRQLLLPPGTHHVDLQFDAVEISSPEKIKLQYRLDGVDSEWLDAGTSPHAVYSDIPAGAHAFHIRACNRDGIWDRNGIIYSITQQPYFYQTRWFLLAAIALGLLLFVALHRLRLSQATARLNARLEDRLAERTRVARELHDTFLQTVQGSKMVADHALKNSDDHARLVQAMESLSSWLGQATQEGRTALNSLRSSTTETNDLAEALKRATEESRMQSPMEVSLSVVGEAKEMHPIVRDEVYRIGYETIRNACMHSGGTRLEVRLIYADDLALRVSDNGKGIDPEIVEHGKEGHFGIQSIRERAERIGGKLTVVSSAGSGTEIALVVPGRTIFRKAKPSRIDKSRSILDAR
jgi:signal transduction histidine kinase/ligand-binding sensor domain-containing protein